MSNSTKLIMENWRKFINENSTSSKEPEEGYYDDEYNPEGYDPDNIETEPPEGYYDDEYNPEGFDPDFEDDVEERYGYDRDPELPAPTGEPVSDKDLSDFDVVSDEPEEGYYDDEYNPEGFDPDY